MGPQFVIPFSPESMPPQIMFEFFMWAWADSMYGWCCAMLSHIQQRYHASTIITRATTSCSRRPSGRTADYKKLSSWYCQLYCWCLRPCSLSNALPHRAPCSLYPICSGLSCSTVSARVRPTTNLGRDRLGDDAKPRHVTHLESTFFGMNF